MTWSLFVISLTSKDLKGCVWVSPAPDVIMKSKPPDVQSPDVNVVIKTSAVAMLRVAAKARF
jgi:hypothetical protein